jgi:hypothetical protein
MLRNKFNPTMLAVVLIALLCFFLPDVKAQDKIDTSKVYSWSGQRVQIYIPKPDTTEVELFIAKEYPNYREINSNEPNYIKIIMIVDGYMVSDYWHTSAPQYLDNNKQPMKSKVYISLPREKGKK